MSLSIETLALAKHFAKSYTDNAVAASSSGINYKGAVDYYADLPSNAEAGDAYTVKYAGSSPSTDTDGNEYVWAEYENVLQWIIFGPDLSQLSKVIANPTLSGNENSLTGLQINQTKYKIAASGTDVIANEPLTGTEAELTEITIAGTKYKVASSQDFYQTVATAQYGTPVVNP